MTRAGSDLDRHIGGRLRGLRTGRGLSLDALASIIDVSQQQVSRYELGYNRLSAAQLYRLARGLDVPISWFFRDFEEDQQELSRLRLVSRAARDGYRADCAEDRERALLIAWRALPSDHHRDHAVTFLEAFGTAGR